MTLTRTIAEAFGVSEPTVYRALRAGEALSEEEAAQLDVAERPVSMKILQDLARVDDSDERAAVVAKVAGLDPGNHRLRLDEVILDDQECDDSRNPIAPCASCPHGVHPGCQLIFPVQNPAR